MAEGVAVVGAELAGTAVDAGEVVDRYGEVVGARRLGRAGEEMDLRVADPEPLDGHPEVRRRDRLRAEELAIPGDRRGEVRGVDADVVDADGGHGEATLSSPERPAERNRGLRDRATPCPGADPLRAQGARTGPPTDRRGRRAPR